MQLVTNPVIGVAFGVLFAAVGAMHLWHVREVVLQAASEVTFQAREIKRWRLSSPLRGRPRLRLLGVGMASWLSAGVGPQYGAFRVLRSRWRRWSCARWFLPPDACG